MTADHDETGLDRRDLLRLGGLILVLVALVGIVLVAGGGDSDERTSGRMQGVLVEVSQTQLVLQRSTGGEPVRFTVRPEDVRNLDITHLEQHAADALPSIVHYDQVGDERFAVRVDDAPV